MRADIVPGAVFPDCELTDHTAKRRKLSELQGQEPMVLQECRPDWDITTPELKAAWQEGRKALLYPYGMTFAETLSDDD